MLVDRRRICRQPDRRVTSAQAAPAPGCGCSPSCALVVVARPGGEGGGRLVDGAGRARRPGARLRPHPGDQQRHRLRPASTTAATRSCSLSPSAALALIARLVRARHRRGRGLWLGVGLLVGGALGNLADRIRDGAVTDFLDPPLWPAFNLADVAITARGRRDRARRASRPPPSRQAPRAVTRRRGSSTSTTGSR